MTHAYVYSLAVSLQSPFSLYRGYTYSVRFGIQGYAWEHTSVHRAWSLLMMDIWESVLHKFHQNWTVLVAADTGDPLRACESAQKIWIFAWSEMFPAALYRPGCWVLVSERHWWFLRWLSDLRLYSEQASDTLWHYTSFNKSQLCFIMTCPECLLSEPLYQSLGASS